MFQCADTQGLIGLPPPGRNRCETLPRSTRERLCLQRDGPIASRRLQRERVRAPKARKTRTRSRKTMTNRYDAVPLDIDGTLVDRNDAHASAWVDAFCAHGRGLAFDQVRPLVGMGSDQMLAVAASLDHASACCAIAQSGAARSVCEPAQANPEYHASSQPSHGISGVASRVGRRLQHRLDAAILLDGPATYCRPDAPA